MGLLYSSTHNAYFPEELGEELSKPAISQGLSEQTFNDWNGIKDFAFLLLLWNKSI